jgi:hypothetical protein
VLAFRSVIIAIFFEFAYVLRSSRFLFSLVPYFGHTFFYSRDLVRAILERLK